MFLEKGEISSKDLLKSEQQKLSTLDKLTINYVFDFHTA